MSTLAIVGASGVCGREAVIILNEQTDIYVKKLYLFASARSSGESVDFRGSSVIIEEYTSDETFADVDFVILFTPTSLSKEIVSNCKKSSNSPVIIDNSSAFRMDPNVPLVIPEITKFSKYSSAQVISNPNCSTIILLHGLYHLMKSTKNKIKSVDVTTFQAVSGAGKEGLDELKNQILSYPGQASTDNFGRQILCNVIPHESDIDPNNGYNQEEIKIVKETEKILEIPNFPIDVECSRAGVERCHLEVVKVKFETPYETPLNTLIDNAWNDVPGVKVVSSLSDKTKFMDPLSASSTNDVYISRIRFSHNDPRCLKFRLVGDQLRVGAAWNALKIFRILSK